MKKKLLLIKNPAAGVTILKVKDTDLVQLLSIGYYVDVYHTKGKYDAMDVAARRGADYDTVAAWGGDGTINEVISGLMKIPSENRAALLCIPAGTTNQLADAIGLPLDMLEAALVGVTGALHPLDVGMIDDVSFATAVSFGVFTDSSYDTPQALKNLFGYPAYFMGAIRSLPELRSYKMTISANGESFGDEYILGAVSNVLSVGGLIRMREGVVKTDDGLFEVVLIKKPQTPGNMLKILTDVAMQEYDMKSIKVFHSDHIKMEIDEEIPWTVDGEYRKDFGSVDIKLLPGAIRVYRPNIPELYKSNYQREYDLWAYMNHTM